MEKSGEVGGEHERHPPSTISLTPSHVGDTLSHAGHPPSTNSDTFSHGTTHLAHSLITVSYLQHFAQDRILSQSSALSSAEKNTAPVSLKDAVLVRLSLP